MPRARSPRHAAFADGHVADLAGRMPLQHAQRLGQLEVKVVRVKYGAVRAKDLNNEVITTDDTNLLAITVSVHNRGARAPCVSQLVRGRVDDDGGVELLPELWDDAGPRL